jgi:hypothetical protein
VKTTVDLPDDLLRRAKAKAAMEGKKLRELLQEGLERVLHESEADAVRGPQPSAFDRVQDGCGIVSSGVGDLSSNPRHLDRFGDE